MFSDNLKEKKIHVKSYKTHVAGKARYLFEFVPKLKCGWFIAISSTV